MGDNGVAAKIGEYMCDKEKHAGGGNLGTQKMES